MATPVGTTYSLVKRSLIQILQATSELSEVAVNYDAPVQAEDVTGATGLLESIYYADTDPAHLRATSIEGEHKNKVICRLPLEIDEEYEIPLAIVVVKPEEGTQEEADERVDQIMFHVIKAVAQQPSLGVVGPSHPEIKYVMATRFKFLRTAGVYGPGRGSGITMKLVVEARIQYVTL